MIDAEIRCLCLTGPTACGKSDLGIGLAQRLPLEIVSMDSAMVYRGMDIGTAKPPPAVRAAVPHHLIDVADPSEAYSAGRFRRDALRALRAIRGRERLPLLVGGTLLYLRALRAGLASLPQADPEVRRALDAQAERYGWPALHARLATVDPIAARRIAPNDRQRIQRALEVYDLTGRPVSELQAADAGAGSPQVAVAALMPESRAALAQRIEQRFDAMVEGGLVEEVARLRARGDLHPALPAMRAVGYRQVWAYLEGRLDWQETRRQALVATRRLAKRQMTWLRGEPGVELLPAFSAGGAERLLEWARGALPD